jgi:hypothetical protein
MENEKSLNNDSNKKKVFRVLFLPLIRLRMMNHATSAVFAISNPIPINVIPTTRSRGSASSSGFLASAQIGSTLKNFKKFQNKNILCK